MDNGLSLYSLEAEQSVLGGLMLSDNAWDRVSDKLKAAHFVDEGHAAIFTACEWLATNGSRMDALLVSDRLRQTGELDRIGGNTYLGQLVANCASTANIDHYARVVADRFNLRKLSAAVAHCSAILADPDTDLHEKAEAASSAILGAIDDASSDMNLFTVKDGAHDLYLWLQQAHQAGGKLSGISTGFPDIDKRCNGLHGGELWIVAARPGMGKTNFALNVAGHAAKAGHKVAFFSMEMSKRELSGRLAACLHGMNYGAMQSQDWENFGGALANFVKDSAGLTMRIDDRASQTVERIKIATKKAARQMQGLDLVVVDYLQLIKGEGGSRYEQVTNISRELKVMAKDMNVPVLCLAQISRAAMDGNDKRPHLHHLKDSGAIEQDADVVVMLHRDDNPDGTHSQYAEAIFRKIRHGQPGTDPLLVDFNHCRFLTADRDGWEASLKTREQQSSRKGSTYS